jgi:hypothetical protein
MNVRSSVFGALLVALSLISFSSRARAQTPPANDIPGKETDPSAALISALTAACRMKDADFAVYLTADNAAAFEALPMDQRLAFMRRLSLTENAGRPLLSSDLKNHPILRCEALDGTTELRLGDARIRENLAFVPVSVPGGQSTQFGMVRENGGWRILSLGLVLFDIPALSHQWAAAELTSQENLAIKTLRDLADTIHRYNDAFGRLPESLSELGPAPPDQISPEQANMIDASLAEGKANGYIFRYRIIPDPNGASTKFELAASPAEYGKTGRRSFFLDGDGNLHGADKRGAVATGDDPAIPAEKSE